MNIIKVVFKKELRDIFRDKKALFASILIPLLLFPVIYGFIGKGMSKSVEDVSKNTKIAIIEQEKSGFGDFLRNKENFKVVEVDDIAKAIEKDEIYIAVKIAKDFDKDISSEKDGKISLIYDFLSDKSLLASKIIEGYRNEYSNMIIAERLTARGMNISILDPVKVNRVNALDDVNKDDGEGKRLLGTLLPMILLIFCASGPLTSATDLGAGEKERGTLEPLLSTKANRFSLLWGKFLAITVMGIITALCSIIGIIISSKNNSQFFGEVSGIGYEPIVLVFIGLITVLVTMTFGALELAISIYARSFKEAQSYLTPVTMIALFAGYTSFMIDAKGVGLNVLCIPFVNAVVVLKQLALGIVDYGSILITIAFLVIYVVGSVLFARHMFGKESVIFRT